MSQYVEHAWAGEQIALRAVDVDNCTWDAFVDRHAHAHLLQTSGWAALKQKFGWSAFRVVLADAHGNLTAGASVLMRGALGVRVAYIPRGPLTDWTDTALTGALLDEIEFACRQRGAAVLKIEPGLRDTPRNRLMLARYGFAPSRQTVQPRSTIVLDIAGDESTILKRMKSKWRYNIRLSGRKGVAVRMAESRDLAPFNALMLSTGERDGFGVHSPEYYRAAYELLTPDRATYLFAEYDDQPLAAIVVGVTGETAWYLWGASANRERNRMPNHALQWAGIQWARARGATRYDLWGVPDDLGKVAVGLSRTKDGTVKTESLPVELSSMPREKLWGVYRFKQGFGGEVVRDVGAWDRPLNSLRYRLYGTGLAVRRHRRELPGRLRALVDAGVRDRGDAKGAGAPVAVPEEWRTALGQLPSPHVLQSWEWGDIKAHTGWHADRVVLKRDSGEVFAAFQFLWRDLGANLPVRIGYAPKGPTLDWHDSDSVDLALDAIESHTRRRNCIFVKIDPDVRSDRAEGVILTSKLKRRGWRFSKEQIQFQNTAYSDLRTSEDALLSNMKSKWRYNIRLARRRGITVRQGTPDDLNAFYAMYAETGARDGFLIRPFSYYSSTWQTMLSAQRDSANPAGGALLLAEHEEETDLVAGIFLMKYGERTWYFYGASTERRRRDMPNHLLQWEAMCWARHNGCAIYDWWGAPTDLDDPTDSMQGVWQFKQGFGATFRPHIGAWDYVTNPLLYALYSEAIPRVLDLMKRWNRGVASGRTSERG